MASQSSKTQSGKFPLDNLTYDIISILHEKSKGLEVYEKYIKDAQSDPAIRQLFEQIRSQDQQVVQQLEEHLGRMIGQRSSKSATATGTTARK
ncbi:MAG TPA: hypothetical protein VNO14_18835 [Blastocatellia bacterium]|nr:hypothetical protein [Blastocatellia bacterium]